MMADSTVFAKSSDIGKLKVVELKKELKSRGLSTVGDKSELTARLQGALSKDSLVEDTLDSDELDSDGVLDDDDEDKAVGDLIAEDIISNESEVSASTNITLEAATSNSKPDTAVGDTLTQSQPARTLKRRLPPTISCSESINEDKLLSPDSEPSPPKTLITAVEDTVTPAKKIILNRAVISAPAAASGESAEKVDSSDKVEKVSKIIKVSMDPKERLEMRAKRFGLPVTETAAKDARRARFGLGAAAADSPSRKIEPAAEASIDVLKKRAERFGVSVSKVMVDVENKEKIEKRKAKFGLVKT